MSTRRSTRERPRGDLVHGPVQVVDPALQRDGEIDEILLATAEQHALRRANRLQLPPREARDDQREPCDGAGRDRDPFRGRESHGASRRARR